MKKALWILILALFVFALAACNLFFDPKTIRYSVTSTSAVNIDVAGAGEDGEIFIEESTWTDWGYSFEVKYTDFPFEAVLVVVNNSGTDTVTMRVYLEDSQVTSKTVLAGETEMISPLVSY
jgi:hypothetical protein